MLAIVALALIVVVAGASGHGVTKYASKVKITAVNTTPKRGTHYFHGVVKSEKKACYQQRLVNLYRDDGGGPLLVDHITTNNRGKWTYPIDVFPSGAYYARVSVITTPSYVCKGDKSNTYVR